MFWASYTTAVDTMWLQRKNVASEARCFGIESQLYLLTCWVFVVVVSLERERARASARKWGGGQRERNSTRLRTEHGAQHGA